MDLSERGLLIAKGFTGCQADAIIKLKAFYYSKDLIFTLSGAAGTGKTYVIKYFLDYIAKYNICVTAPTHKAVRVVEKMTGRKGKTLQSLHGLRPNVNLDNFNIDNVKFDTLGEPNIRNYHCVIIDECSMINTDLFRLNESRAKQYNVKVIYVGDVLQLPPIRERVSNTFLQPNVAVLTEIVRQKDDNPLLDILSILREDITNQTSNFINYIRANKECLNPFNEGFVVQKEEDFTKSLINTFSNDALLTNTDFVRFTSWTNANIRKWNKIIRNALIKENDDIAHIDDLFVGYTTIVDDNFKPIIINSDDYIVTSITSKMSDHKFKIWIIGIVNAYKFASTIRLVDHTDKSFITFYNILNSLHYNAVYSTASDRRKNWKRYYDFKNSYLLMVDLPLSNRGDTKPRGTAPKDIDYGYGLTIHKSQGSTYDNVFVDLNDIIYYPNGKLIVNDSRNPNAIEFRNKLLYVAISRASKKVNILI